MFVELLRSRRSIRQFQDKSLEKEKIDLLAEAALRSPSSRGSTPWEFVFVTDKLLLEQLGKARPHGSAFVANSALAVVVCANPETSDVWVEDASIAALILHLAAADLGLGSCWMQVRNRPHDEQTDAGSYIKKLLEIDDKLMIQAVIGIGYPAETKAGHGREKLLDERISFNRYGAKRG